MVGSSKRGVGRVVEEWQEVEVWFARQVGEVGHCGVWSLTEEELLSLIQKQGGPPLPLLERQAVGSREMPKTKSNWKLH
jgi:hypothetical protein